MPPTQPPTLPEAVRTRIEERARTGDLELPVLRESASRVLAMSQTASCDLHVLCNLLERDQALAAGVLHMANAAAFAPREPIVSLQQAVARLGLGTLCEVTMAVVLKGNVFDVPGFEGTLKSLWHHSAATGAFAKEIARLLRRNVEGAFLCGLLHDVGKPVVLKLLAKACQDADVALEPDLAEAAMDHFHAPLGALLVEQWGLAPWVARAAEFHHEVERAEEHPLEVRVTALADELAHWALEATAEEGGAEGDRIAGLQVVADLDLYDDDVQRLLRERERVLEFAEAFA